MAHSSPLRGAQVDSISACGKVLRSGQSITVPESAIGPREKKLVSQKKLSIRTSNTAGHVQVVCTL